MIENYIAFDFETASGKNPCSIGIVEFFRGEVVNEYYSLINPKIDKFNPFTTRIHGIKESDVINEREFNEIWSEINHFFDNKTIIAHNSSFDISVLNYSLERYNLSKPVNNCYCTLRLSRQLLELENYKLNTVAKYYSIQQNNYHNALEDAFVCGKIFANLLSEVEDVTSILNKKSNHYIKRKIPQSQIKSAQLPKESEDELVELRLKFSRLYGLLSNRLEGQTFVVSGVFETVSRTELKKLIEDNGGKVSSSISSKTSYLVAGDKMGPSKRSKAEGLCVPIISEQDFLNLII